MKLMLKKLKNLNLWHYFVMLVISFFVLLPFYWMIITSIKPNTEVLLTPATWFPSRIDLSNYINVWKVIDLFKYLKNSLIIAVATTLFCVIIATLTGYSLSRFKTKLHRFSSALFIFTQLIPSILPFIAYYFLLFNMKMTNTYISLIFTYAIWGVPFCTLMMKNYFKAAMPKSLEESSMIDGCTKFGTFIKIAVPLAVPGIIAISIFAFILAWNEFMFASVMLTNSELKPVSVAIYDFIGQFGNASNVSMSMTVATITTIPAMVIFAFLQRYLISGMTAGAVKE